MNFDTSIKQAELALMEAVTPMSRKQKKKVATLSRSGWEIDDRKDGEIIMSKDEKTYTVKGDGQVTTLKEGHAFDITDIVSALTEEE